MTIVVGTAGGDVVAAATDGIAAGSDAPAVGGPGSEASTGGGKPLEVATEDASDALSVEGVAAPLWDASAAGGESPAVMSREVAPEECVSEDAAAEKVAPEAVVSVGPLADQPKRTPSAIGEIVLRSKPCVGAGTAGVTTELGVSADAATAPAPTWAAGPKMWSTMLSAKAAE